MPKSLGRLLKDAREARGLSLRDVERRTEIRNAHLSQIENDAIAQPEMAMLWELASLYGIEYRDLLTVGGYDEAEATSGRQRNRMTVAMRAMGELTPKEQTEALEFMAKLKNRRASG